ncbi:MAG: hypothetical protein JW809_18645 [Pirellulales bacterium]|nr:hypothetical protein [Pirellulales bacterium]
MDEPWDLPETELDENAGWIESAEEENPAVEDASTKHVGSWNRLVSTTNWEKGRIILAWREDLLAVGASAAAYGDDAWARRVGGVTPQHVGRLRRVFQRFGDTHARYDGLFWSHFQAALDWDDAEMWLEGAVQSGWSVLAMRERRWRTLGAPAGDEPRADDAFAAELDEDAIAPGEPLPRELSAKTAVVEPTDDAADDDPASKTNRAQHERRENEGQTVLDARPTVEPVRPFEDLPELPDDLADAIEALKLAIVRHKLAGWRDVRADDVLAALNALKQLALAPAESA